MQSWLQDGVMPRMKVGVAYQATRKQIQCTVEITFRDPDVV